MMSLPTNEEIDLLVIDDEVNILNSLKRIFMDEPITVHTISDPQETFNILKQKNVKVVLVDERMPYASGIEILKEIKEKYPEIIRILFTGFADVRGVAQDINEGEIYRIISKPWNDKDLKTIIRKAIEKFDLTKKK